LHQEINKKTKSYEAKKDYFRDSRCHALAVSLAGKVRVNSISPGCNVTYIVRQLPYRI
jgi:hypothetical protein